MQTENKPAETQQQSALSRYSAWRKKRKEMLKEKEKNKTIPQKILSWVWVIVWALIIGTALRMFVCEPIRVDGTSMTNTLLNGEVVLAMKVPYLLGEPQRNDVVICRYPNRVNELSMKGINFSASIGLDFYTIFVKRLVAVPGDYLQISNGQLYVNGVLVPNPEKMASIPMDYGPILLGADQYFVMGDNRYSSHDSRASDVGPISRSAIMGKVTHVLLPLGNARAVE